MEGGRDRRKCEPERRKTSEAWDGEVLERKKCCDVCRIVLFLAKHSKSIQANSRQEKKTNPNLITSKTN